MPSAPKNQPVRDRAYLNSQHQERCEITGQFGNGSETVDPIHLGGSMGSKRGDDETMPVLHRYHAMEHQRGTAWLLRTLAPDSLLIAMARSYCRERYRNWKSNRG